MSPRAAAGLLALTWLAACASSSPGADAHSSRPFVFARDTFAYSNDLYWEYGPDGTPSSRGGAPPGFGNRCALMARGARQFHRSARFDPAGPVLAEAEYRTLVRRVLATDRNAERFAPTVVIPGYADLREFSAAHEDLLKEESGGRLRSYTQRGNWRLLMPFSPRGQRELSRRLVAELASGRLPIVHLANFPGVNINHTVVVFRAEETLREVRFEVYDPNYKVAARGLVYDRESRVFRFDRTEFFPGGSVLAWEVYRGLVF
ncbi:MAG: hypothetical protein ACR2P8_01800 [Myxococcota bacterium]